MKVVLMEMRVSLIVAACLQAAIFFIFFLAYLLQYIYMSSKYFYTTILSFTLGIFIGSFYTFGWLILWWLLSVLIILLLWWGKNLGAIFTPHLLFFVVASFCITLGLFRTELTTYLKPDSAFKDSIGQKIDLVGVVVAEPEISDKATKLTVAIDDELLLVTTDRYANVHYGDNISFTGKIKVPEAFETDLGREFDYPGYLAVRGIYYLVSYTSVTVLEHDKGNYILSKIYQIKNQFLGALSLSLPEPEVSLGDGLLLGVKQALGTELESDFRTAGIIHIVVLSGYNLMLVGLFISYLLSFFLSQRPRLICGMVAIVLFAILVGLSATVVRATVMALLTLLSGVIGKRYQVLRSLLFAGFIMLVINPLLLVHDVGFQLSFMATLGLIVISPLLQKKLSKLPLQGIIKNYLLPTLATQIMVLPILLYQMGQFSVVAVVVNLLVLPVVSAAMLLTFITGTLYFIFAPLAQFVAYPAYFSLRYIIEIVQFFAHLPFASFNLPVFPFIVVVLCYVGIGWYLHLKIKIANNPLKEIKLDFDVSHWTIVEELDRELGINNTKNTAPNNDAVLIRDTKDTDLPIFFR